MAGEAMTPPNLALSAQLQRLQFALQAAQVGTWDLDIVNQLVWWDERCKQLYGFRQNDVVPYNQVLSYIHPDDQSQVSQAVQWALNPRSGGQYAIKFRTIGAEDGQLRWLRCQGQAYFDDQGIAYRFSGIAQDITERQQAESALGQSEGRLRAVLESLVDGIYIGGMEGITLINQPALMQLGYSTAEDLNRNIGTLAEEINTRDWLTGELIPVEHQAFARALGGERVVQDVVVRHRMSGEDRIVRCAAGPVMVDEQIVAAVAVNTDVTEQRQAAEMLRQSEERYRQLARELEERVQDRTRELLRLNHDLQRSNDNLQQFAYIASHDLQEPLRKIQSFSSLLLQSGDQLTEQSQDYLGRITQAGTRMSTLIKDLLSYSRIATRQQAFGMVSLQAIVADMVSLLDMEISQRQAQLTIKALPVVKGDESQLSQLFQNLLANALKFTAPDQSPRVTITCSRQERRLLPPTLRLSSDAPFFYQISVADKGIGFDTKYLDRIFQVFQRLHGRNEYPGSGIGLAICQRVVENHGGGLTARSEPGRGATFDVYLPA